MTAAFDQKSSNNATAAGASFDRLAAGYDGLFTDSIVGRAQRNAVWAVLRETFHADDNILELNCGTGEDAVFLAEKGISVFACDASEQMIVMAEQRLSRETSFLPVVFCQIPTEHIGKLNPELRFDGAFSNFSGLNCVDDLDAVASALSRLVNDGGSLLLCFSTRFCLIETLHYILRGRCDKAFRRWRGRTTATLGGLQLSIYYPTLSQIRRSFAPYFRLRSYKGVGVAIPPSYCEDWAQRHQRAFRLLIRLEDFFATSPILRTTGDHVLLSFEKVPQ